jgi:hypothetical protein
MTQWKPTPKLPQTKADLRDESDRNTPHDVQPETKQSAPKTTCAEASGQSQKSSPLGRKLRVGNANVVRMD